MEHALKELDTQLVQAAKGLKLLSHVSWSVADQEEFLAACPVV